MPWNRRSHLFWLDRVGGWMLRIMVIGLVALTAAQMLMTSEPLRLYMSFAERMESRMAEADNSSELVPAATSPASGEVEPGKEPKGYEIAEEEISNTAELTISLTNLTSLENALVRVNGKPAGNLGNREVTVKVSGGDIIDIDTSFYPYQVEITITNTSPNLLYPRAHLTLTLKEEVVRLGPVKVK